MVLDVFLKGGRAVGRKPGYIVHLPEPGRLPLGIMARVGLGRSHGLLAADLAPEEPQDMAVAEGAERRRVLGDAPFEEAPDLLDRPPLEHLFDAVVDAPVERVPFEPEAEAQDVPALDRRFGPAEVLGDRQSGRGVGLESEADPDAARGPDLP